MLRKIASELTDAPVREQGTDLRALTAGYVRLDPIGDTRSIERAARRRRTIVLCRIAGRTRRGMKRFANVREVVSLRLLDGIANAIEKICIVSRLVTIDVDQPQGELARKTLDLELAQ